MPTIRKPPFFTFNFELKSLRPPQQSYAPANALGDEGMEIRRKKWYEYLPVIGTVLLILAVHPSLLYVLYQFYIKVHNAPITFIIVLLTGYTITFLTFSSMIICVCRDPGKVSISEIPSKSAIGSANDTFGADSNSKSAGDDHEDNDEDGEEEMSMTDALMSSEFESFEPGRWCRKCWAPKPERTHHCGSCGRCVLKMDHHCPWIGNCVGHSTYPAFVHFIACVTILAIYVASVSIRVLYYSFSNPYLIDEDTPIHAMLLALTGVVFTIVVGSFLGYHIYLITTNQTTLEYLSPFLLLKYLPPLPASGHSLSSPPLEAELNFDQRCLVKEAHHVIRIYDVGWKRNWSELIGYDGRMNRYARGSSSWKKYKVLAWRILCGGGSNGDGKTFPRNDNCDALLARLANELVKADTR